jgi:hypothetical protein
MPLSPRAADAAIQVHAARPALVLQLRGACGCCGVASPTHAGLDPVPATKREASPLVAQTEQDASSLAPPRAWARRAATFRSPDPTIIGPAPRRRCSLTATGRACTPAPTAASSPSTTPSTLAGTRRPRPTSAPRCVRSPPAHKTRFPQRSVAACSPDGLQWCSLPDLCSRFNHTLAWRFPKRCGRHPPTHPPAHPHLPTPNPADPRGHAPVRRPDLLHHARQPAVGPARRADAAAAGGADGPVGHRPGAGQEGARPADGGHLRPAPGGPSSSTVAAG